eukprot:2083514-Pyramimonas_sp.AAC.1
MKDESGLAAVFADAASAASHIKASKLRDATALLPGNRGQQSDALGAYTQALLYGDGRIDPVDTWVILPKWRQPSSWAKYQNPVSSGNDTAVPVSNQWVLLPFPDGNAFGSTIRSTLSYLFTSTTSKWQDPLTTSAKDGT